MNTENKSCKHRVDNDILCNDQHGFVRGRSTFTNLLGTLNDWTHNVQDNCDVIYIDFSKAFDVIQHDKLFLKLRSYGICECDVLLEWRFYWEYRHFYPKDVCCPDKTNSFMRDNIGDKCRRNQVRRPRTVARPVTHSHLGLEQ